MYFRVSCRHRDKSCLERVLLIGPPKAQPPGNAQAHERQTLAISGERSRLGDPPKGSSAHEGARSLRSKGQRGMARGCQCRLYFCREVAMGLKTALYDTHVLQGAKIVD